jgi:integrase
MRIGLMRSYIRPETKNSQTNSAAKFADRDRQQYRRRYPVDVAKHLGKEVFVHKFAVGMSRADAEKESTKITAIFDAKVDAIRARLRGDKETCRVDTMDVTGEITARVLAKSVVAGDTLGAKTLRIHGCAPSGTVEYVAVVNAWADEKSKLPASRANRMRKMAALAAFLGHPDIARVTPDDLQHYKESLIAKMKAGQWQPKTVDDHIEMVKAMFRWAKENRKISTNPAADLRAIGAKTDPRKARKDFGDADIRLILTAARDSDPVIRWSNWLAAMSGARLAEIIEANTADIEITPDGAVFHVRYDYRTEQQRLKNEESVRSFPIHSAVMREGFGEYVASLSAGPLFPTVKIDRDGLAANNASHILNPWLRDIGITDPRKVFHSHRHTFKTRCRGRMEEEIHDAISGHSNGSIGRGYGEYPMPVLREAIERLPDPTVSVGQVAA